jgi:hypothetical protein
MSSDRVTRVTIRAAAEYLDISENAVRQRIKRGSLQAVKVAGVWRVQLPDDQAGDQQRDRSSTSTATTSDHEVNSALVEQLQSEVAFLRAELEARREADREQRIIISQLVGRVEALQAGYEAPQAPPEQADRPSDGEDDDIEIDDEPEQAADIWETTSHQDAIDRWWSELEARTEAPDSMEGDDSTTGVMDTPPRRWWRFWR